jgi:serine protease
MFTKKTTLAIIALQLIVGLAVQNTAFAGGPLNPRRYTMPKTAELFNDRITVRFSVADGKLLEKGTVPTEFDALFKKWGVRDFYKRFRGCEVPTQAFINGERTVDLNPIFVLKVSAMTNLEAMINDFLQVSSVEYAEPIFWDRISVITNDPLVTGGQSYFLRNIDAYDAWNTTTGSSNVIIATVDSGTDIDHPDLVDNFYRNPDEIPGDSIDNDLNGYVDDVIGWDFAGNDFNNPSEDNNPGVTGSNNSHGVHVGGTSGATGNNRLGVAGVAYGCKAMPIKASADNDSRAGGSGFILGGYEGIAYAANNGARVINCSFGSAQFSSASSDVIRFATVNRGAFIVAAAGNDNVQTPHYPSDLPFVFSVAALNDTDRKAGFSNYSERVDISAPGVSILSTTFDNTYEQMSGTSMASPIVAGVAGLLRSKYPWMTPAQVEAQLEATADNIYNLPANRNFINKLGAGRINANRALTETFPSFQYRITRAATSEGSPLVEDGDTIIVTGNVTNMLFPSSNRAGMRIRLNSEFVSLVSSDSLYIGRIEFGGTRNQSNPFLLAIRGAIPENHDPNMTATFTDSAGFTRTVSIPLKLNTSTVDIIKTHISTTITSNSRFGFGEFNDTTKGLGFRLRNLNALFEAGVFMGTSADSLSDNLRNQVVGTVYNYNSDFVPVSPIRRTLDTVNQIRYEATFDDRNAVKPLGVTVVQTAYDTKYEADSNFIIMTYAITNNGRRALNNFRFGFFTDFDISPGGTIDRMVSRPSENLAIMIGTSGVSRLMGIFNPDFRIASRPYGIFNNGPTVANNIEINDGFTKAEKWISLSNTIQSASVDPGDDISMVMNYGPFNLAIGETITIPVGIVADWNLAGIQRSTSNARRTWQLVTTSKEKLTISDVQVYPNPATNQVKVNLAVESAANLSITDLAGRVLLQTTIAEPTNTLDISGYQTGLYLINIQQGNKKGTFKLLVK